MPKMKTKSGAAKRFKKLASGRVQARQREPAPHPHQESTRSASGTCAARTTSSTSDKRAVQAMLPY